MPGRFTTLRKNKKKRRSSRVRRFSTPGCPLVRNRASWCMRLCEPIDGLGTCGRLAPHSLKGRTQRAIERSKQRSDG